MLIDASIMDNKTLVNHNLYQFARQQQQQQQRESSCSIV
jgi:hypothetical protein